MNYSISKALTGNILSQVHDLRILTDAVNYPGIDQVFPMYPEQPFFLDELKKEKIRAAHVLEIELGSGVLSIGALKSGADKVTALEINPRAKLYAGFHALMNGVHAGLSIVDGNRQDLWAPVRGQNFDYIMSNPPFMPTPEGAEHYFHSGGGGILGLDFLENIFRELDDHLKPSGHAQIVTTAPGDNQLPIDPQRIDFKLLAQHLPTTLARQDIDQINEQLIAQGITHQYLCVIHYDKGEHEVKTRFCNPHPAWDMPLAEQVS